jgi:NAD(P)H-nitrite reductase large subunit
VRLSAAECGWVRLVAYQGLKMSKTEFWKEKDPSKNVVCKCERVTEAEVVEAIRRSLPIDSTQVMTCDDL